MADGFVGNDFLRCHFGTQTKEHKERGKIVQLTFREPLGNLHLRANERVPWLPGIASDIQVTGRFVPTDVSVPKVEMIRTQR